MSAGGSKHVSSVIISEEGELLKGWFTDQISNGQTDARELDLFHMALTCPKRCAICAGYQR
jgi:hypothetical protein